KYMPYTLVKNLMVSGNIAEIGGDSKNLTILFSDIENFTPLSEKMPPRDLMLYLSEYFETATKIIIKNGGTVDKYIGDGILAFWGAPIDDKNHAIHCCNTALELQEAFKILNLKWRSEGKPEIMTRIGINTGNVVVGNIGSEDRLNYTVIGDQVNLASRMESLSKIYGTRIIVSEMLSAVVPLLAVLIFRNNSGLIYYLLASLILQGLITIAQYSIRAPFKIKFKINTYYWKELLRIGIPLLIYSASYSLITVSGRTIISIFYTTEVMGYYSLANNITAATLLGLNAVSWVIFPDILSRTHAGISNDLAAEVVHKVNNFYGTSVFLAVFGVILGLPILFYFLPQYKPASGVLSVLLLAQALFSISFGYNCVAIARKKQMKVAGISVLTTIIVTGLCLTAAILKMSFLWIGMAALFGAFIYTFLQARLGANLLNLGQSHGYLRSMLPWGSLAATLIFLVGIMAGYPTYAGLVAMSVFIFTNQHNFVLIRNFALQKFGKV
ncbi:MAG: adenylate/guanylate cyclase domain-containing protein, partial [Chloroflexota bacterium]